MQDTNKSKNWGVKLNRKKDNYYNTNTLFNLTWLDDSRSDEIWKWKKIQIEKDREL